MYQFPFFLLKSDTIKKERGKAMRTVYAEITLKNVFDEEKFAEGLSVSMK
jgi:hypothetical protein